MFYRLFPALSAIQYGLLLGLLMLPMTTNAYITPEQFIGGSSSDNDASTSSTGQTQGNNSADQPSIDDVAIPSLDVIDPKQQRHPAAPKQNRGILQPQERSPLSKLDVGRSISPQAIADSVPQVRTPPAPRRQPPPPRPPLRNAPQEPSQQALPGSGMATNALIFLSVLLSASIFCSRRFFISSLF